MFYFSFDIVRQFGGRVVVGHIRLDDNPYFASGLQGVSRCHAVVRSGNFFEGVDSFNVRFDRFETRAFARRRYRVGRAYENGFYRFGDAFFVMREYCVDHLWRFAVFAGEVRAYYGVRAFRFAGYNFAYIVQKSGAFSELNVGAEFAGHYGGEFSDFDGVLQLVLTVRRSVVEFAYERDEFRMQALNAEFYGGAFAYFVDRLLDFRSGFSDYFFYARGMNSSVAYEFFERNSCDFTLYGVEARKNDGLRRVVDDYSNAGEAFERSNVTPFAAYYAAFHIFVGQINYRHHRVDVVVYSATPYGCGYYPFSFSVGRFFGLVFGFFYFFRDFALQLHLDSVKDVIAGFVHAETRDLFKPFDLLFFQGFRFGF